MDTQNILIQEASREDAVEYTLVEDNSGTVHHENDTKSSLLSGIGMTPAQLTKVQGYNISNIQSDLELSVMLTENEGDICPHPPSKRLKTEQNMQDRELVADGIEGCLVDTQSDKESESKVNEKESQQSDIGCLLRTTDLLPEDQNNIDANAESKKTFISNDAHCNRIDFSSAIEKSKINDAEETTENDRLMKSRTLIPNNQELETECSSQETLINTTNRPASNNLNVECTQREIIIYESQNQTDPNQETTLNETSYGKNNCFSPEKEKNGSIIEGCSEGKETATDESGTDKDVKNESNSDFVSNDTTTDNQQNLKHVGNNESPSDVIVVPNEIDAVENHCVFTDEKGNGEELVDTVAETNLHLIILEEKKSWTSVLQNEVFKLVDIPCDSVKYTEMKTLFHNTTQKHFKLNKIVEVQNPFLYSCYILKKAEMMSRYGHIKEEYLFHGTKIRNISSICETNLDWRKHGSVTGNIFGKGVSLTPISCYASHYSDKHTEEKIMFVFRVAIANEIGGSPDMVLPPYKDGFKELRYDTAVKPNRQVIVKFSDNEFYPEYLLYYTGKYKRYIDFFDDDSD